MSSTKFTRGERAGKRSFGLPPLRLSDAAALLGVEQGQFEVWIVKHPRFSPQQRSMWLNGKRPLSPEVLELYLREHAMAAARAEKK